MYQAVKNVLIKVDVQTFFCYSKRYTALFRFYYSASIIQSLLQQKQ